MEMTKLLLTEKFVFILLAMVVNTVLMTTASDSSVNADFEGKSLVAMGTAMNSPLLRLLGRTFEKLERDVTKDVDNKTAYVLSEVKKDNSSLEQRIKSERKELIDIICQIHVCTDWTQWSDCNARIIETYGSQTRSRKCGTNGISLCTNTGQTETDTDARVCEGSKCPNNYIATDNGFCIGVHSDVQHNWTTAQAVCKQEGGYLVNVDSVLKAVDVSKTLQQLSSTDDLWIDGTRTLPSGAWRYEYGPEDPAYTNWASSEPDNTDDCKAYDDINSGRLEWWGRPCKEMYYFICEVV